MKAAAELVNYVILGVIVLALAIGVYMWGYPMLQKSQVKGSMEQLSKVFTDIANLISSVGTNGGQSSMSVDLGRSSISININNIKYQTTISVSYFNPNIGKVPINYKVYYPCSTNTTLQIGSTINLCGFPGLYASANSTNIIINDTIFGGYLVLPLGSYNNVITSTFVFDVIYNGGSTITFVPRYNTGLYGSSQFPPCIVDAYQSSDVVFMEVSCRPLVDVNSRTCYWIKIVPEGSTSGTGKVNIYAINRGYTITKPLSTVCDNLQIINVGVSVS